MESSDGSWDLMENRSYPMSKKQQHFATSLKITQCATFQVIIIISLYKQLG